MSNLKHVLSALTLATMVSPLAMAKTVSPSIGKIRQPSQAQSMRRLATPKSEVSPASPREPKAQAPATPRRKTTKHRTARLGKTKTRAKRGKKVASGVRHRRAKVGASVGHRAARKMKKRTSRVARRA